MAQKPKTRLKIWTSSHGLDRRHFPALIKEKMEAQKRFLEAEIFAKSGQRLNKSLVKLIKSDAINYSPRNQVHVLILGK